MTRLQLLQIVVALILAVTVVSCSKKNKWEGIWRGEVEVLPGFKTPLEFNIIRDKNMDGWTGRFEVVDLMAIGPIASISLTDSSAFIDLGEGWTLRGQFPQSDNSILAVIIAPEAEPDTIRFQKSDYWLSEMPARLDKDGKRVTSWTYRTPRKTNDGWGVSTIREAQKDVLKNAFEEVVKGKDFNGLDAVLVAHKGRIVLEEYFHTGAQDKPHGIQSDTKSVNSLLVGIALQEGKLKSIDVPVENFFRHYVDTMSRTSWNVSVRDALMMAASLDWKEGQMVPYSDPANDAVRMNNSKDMYHFVLSHLPKENERPGTTFSYNSGISVLLGGIVKQATGLSADEYARQTLFRDLAIEKFHWFSFRGQTHTGGGLHLLPRDLLKIGQLVLDSGKWNDKQIILKSWIKESTAFHLRTSDSDPKEGYGYQWWRNSFKVERAEHPYIYASGYGGQFLFIIPSLDLVIVTLNHMIAVEENRKIIGPKEVEELIVPAFK